VSIKGLPDGVIGAVVQDVSREDISVSGMGSLIFYPVSIGDR
jgi:hypothetical protein